MTPDDATLCANLRAVQWWVDVPNMKWRRDESPKAAADRIEQLSARNAELEAENERLRGEAFDLDAPIASMPLRIVARYKLVKEDE